MPTFTIMTPTYNRANTLPRVYESLCAQTVQDFEWLVVDDGSTDNTAQIMADLQSNHQHGFEIRYQYQANQHKKAAVNNGVKAARGTYLSILDSDDSLIPNALQTFKESWDAIVPDQRDKFYCICALCMRPDGQVVGNSFPVKKHADGNYIDGTSLDFLYKFKVKGEKFSSMRTSVLRDYPYPEDIQGHVPESLIWSKIARAGYLMRCINDVVRIYYPTEISLSTEGGE